MSKGPEQNRIHDETKAAADEAFAATLAELGLAPDTPVVVKTADAAAAPVSPVMPDAAVSGAQDVSRGKAAGGRRRQGKAGAKSVAAPPLTDTSKGVESDPYATVVLENGQVWEGVDSQGRTVRCRVSDVHGEHLTENSSTFNSAGRMVEGRAGGRLRDEFIKELRSGKFRLLDATASAPTTAPTTPDAAKPDADAERRDREAGMLKMGLKGDDFLPSKPDEEREYGANGEKGYIRLLSDGNYKIKTQVGAELTVKPEDMWRYVADWTLVGAVAAAAVAAVEAKPPRVEAAPVTPDAGPRAPERTLEQVQAEIAIVDQEVAVARKEYIRIEAEQKGMWERVTRVFRNLRGADEANQDVLAAKEDYEEKLNRLKLLELEKVQLSGLTGDKLRQHLADVLVEYNFNEAERFDNDQREQRDGHKAATFKEKWQRIKANIAKPQRSHDGIHSLNLVVPEPTWKDWLKVGWERSKLVAGSTVALYGEATKTTKGKVISATVGIGAGALFFTSGGAAAGMAGVLYFGRKILAGASAAVATKAALDAGAQWNRKRVATNEAEGIAREIVGGDRNDTRAAFNKQTDTRLPAPDYEHLPISPKGLAELGKYLNKETNWRKQAAKRELWRQSRFWAAAMVGTGLAGWGHWSDVLEKLGISSTATPAEIARVANDGVAPSVAEGASSPASAASAARAAAESASAPAGAASAAAEAAAAPSGSASAPGTGASAPGAEGGVVPAPGTPAPGAPVAPDDGPEQEIRSQFVSPDRAPDPTPFSEGGEVRHQDGYRPSDQPGVAVEQDVPPRAAETVTASGRQEALRMLTDTREIKPGDTVGRFAMAAAREAGLADEAAQRRFARLLVEHINTRLAEATGEAAEAAGFIPNADGRFTADLIPAGGELNLTQIGLTASDIEGLLAQAESGTTPLATPPLEAAPASGGSETISASPADASGEAPAVTTPAATEGVATAVPAPGAAEAVPGATASASEGAASTGARPDVSEGAYVQDETLRRRFATLDYIKSLDIDAQRALFRTAKHLEFGLLRTPEVTGDAFDPLYDPAGNRKLVGAWMKQVLDDYLMQKENPAAMLDRAQDPLHASQRVSLFRFAQAVQEALGKDFARPAPRESVQEYILRSVALAKARGIELPGMVN